MARKSPTTGPEFLRFVEPLVATLKAIGNSGSSDEVTDGVIHRTKLSAADKEATTGNGQPRVRNQIAWARFYLAKAGIIDGSTRGVWVLTPAGQTWACDPVSVREMFKAVQSRFGKADADIAATGTDESDLAPPADSGSDHRTMLLDKLRTLPPAGFEKICQRLLRESGFQQVVVTGRSGDGGIDGHGVLEVNPLVTFKVLFQCKRYSDKSRVTPTQVRDFRGAMAGRADKGIILTTGTFTEDARKEATRDGVSPIELVHGDKLVSMFERVSLGLRPRQTWELDPNFFAEFEK